MSRDISYLRFAAAAIFLALAAYCAAAFMESADAPETVEAVRVSVSRTVHAEGTVLRDEEYVVCPFEAAYFAASEGERVKGGSIVCVSEDSIEDYLTFLDTHDGKAPEKMQGCVRATCSGFFSTELDGWETADAKNLDTFTPHIPENAVGRIVANGWYFVADLKDLSQLYEGQNLTLTVFDDYPAQVTDIDGNRVTIRVKQGLDAMLSTRHTEATLHITETSGIKIPKDTLHSDEDGSYVYTLRAGLSEKTPVTIIYEADDYFLADEDTLREGMLICR